MSLPKRPGMAHYISGFDLEFCLWSKHGVTSKKYDGCVKCGPQDHQQHGGDVNSASGLSGLGAPRPRTVWSAWHKRLLTVTTKRRRELHSRTADTSSTPRPWRSPYRRIYGIFIRVSFCTMIPALGSAHDQDWSMNKECLNVCFTYKSLQRESWDVC